MSREEGQHQQRRSRHHGHGHREGRSRSHHRSRHRSATNLIPELTSASNSNHKNSATNLLAVLAAANDDANNNLNSMGDSDMSVLKAINGSPRRHHGRHHGQHHGQYHVAQQHHRRHRHGRKSDVVVVEGGGVSKHGGGNVEMISKITFGDQKKPFEELDGGKSASYNLANVSARNKSGMLASNIQQQVGHEFNPKNFVLCKYFHAACKATIALKIC